MAKQPKKKLKISPPRIALFTALLFVAVYILTSYRIAPATDMACYGTAEDMLETDGYIFRNETVLEATADGMLSCFVPEGARVQKDTKIAAVFTGAVDETIQNKLIKVNERLSKMEQTSKDKYLFVADPIMLENAIAGRVNDITIAAQQGDAKKASQYIDDIAQVLAVNQTKQSGEQMAPVDTYNQLQQEKEQLESSISSAKTDLFAPNPGVFSTKIDGYEGSLSVSLMETFTPSYLKGLKGNEAKPVQKITKGQPCAKISNNYEWYYTAAVDASAASDLVVGQSVGMRFPEISDQTLSSTVAFVSKEEGGKVALVISCNQSVDDVYQLRKSSAHIIKRSYKGFKLPQSAIQMDDAGNSGVFVIKEGVARYRKVKVEYVTSRYVIVAENNESDNPLLLYDEVIVSPKNIEEGKAVK